MRFGCRARSTAPPRSCLARRPKSPRISRSSRTDHGSGVLRSRLLIAIAAPLFLVGCASYDGHSLIPGKSTETDVEALMGASADRRTGRNGETVRYYSRLPFGRVIFAARFGP